MFVWSVGALEVIVVVDGGGCDVLERVIGGFSFDLLRPHGNCGFFLGTNRWTFSCSRCRSRYDVSEAMVGCCPLCDTGLELSSSDSRINRFGLDIHGLGC
jgi:Zn finger protein HypA/HybF involved in hydrogenase expression